MLGESANAGCARVAGGPSLARAKIGVCIPLGSPWVVAEWALSLRRLKLSPNSEWFFHRGPLPVDKARTRLVGEALGRGCDFIFFLDSDVVVQQDAVLRLLALRYPITSAMIPDKGGRAGAWREGQSVWIERGAAIMDEAVLGACLIDARVFEKVEKPWFVYEFEGGLDNKPSEDMYFFRKCAKFGLKPLVDGDVKGRHIFVGAMTEPTKIEHLAV